MLSHSRCSSPASNKVMRVCYTYKNKMLLLYIASRVVAKQKRFFYLPSSCKEYFKAMYILGAQPDCLCSYFIIITWDRSLVFTSEFSRCPFSNSVRADWIIWSEGYYWKITSSSQFVFYTFNVTGYHQWKSNTVAIAKEILQAFFAFTNKDLK